MKSSGLLRGLAARNREPAAGSIFAAISQTVTSCDLHDTAKSTKAAGIKTRNEGIRLGQLPSNQLRMPVRISSAICATRRFLSHHSASARSKISTLGNGTTPLP